MKNYKSVQCTEKVIGRLELKDAKKNETKVNKGMTDTEEEKNDKKQR